MNILKQSCFIILILLLVNGCTEKGKIISIIGLPKNTTNTLIGLYPNEPIGEVHDTDFIAIGYGKLNKDNSTINHQLFVINNGDISNTEFTENGYYYLFLLVVTTDGKESGGFWYSNNKKAEKFNLRKENTIIARSKFF